MGYWYHINEANFIIPADKVGEAYKRLASVHRYGDEAPADNLPDLLKQIGFGADPHENGDVSIWSGQSKYTYRFDVIAALGDLVPEASYVIWQGEDGGAFVRQIVTYGGKVVEQHGHVTFS